MPKSYWKKFFLFIYPPVFYAYIYIFCCFVFVFQLRLILMPAYVNNAEENFFSSL